MALKVRGYGGDAPRPCTWCVLLPCPQKM